LVGCALGQYNTVSIDKIIDANRVQHRLEFLAYVDLTGPIVDAYDSDISRHNHDSSRCIAVIETDRQVAVLRRISISEPLMLWGDLTGSPRSLSEGELFGAKIDGRTWKGTLCHTGVALFLQGIKLENPGTHSLL
jgi:hypothetical protein